MFNKKTSLFFACWSQRTGERWRNNERSSLSLWRKVISVLTALILTLTSFFGFLFHFIFSALNHFCIHATGQEYKVLLLCYGIQQAFYKGDTFLFDFIAFQFKPLKMPTLSKIKELCIKTVFYALFISWIVHKIMLLLCRMSYLHHKAH